MDKPIKILIDTNVIIDYIAQREPYVEQAVKIVKMCTSGKVVGCIAAHTVTNIFFILRKDFTVAKRKEFLLDLFNEFSVVGIDTYKLIAALRDNKFSDFEDCLQDECAAYFNADYIITRNTKDFTDSKVKAIEPDKFLEIFKN